MKTTTFKRAIIAIAMILVTAATSWAYDFRVNGIYYGINSDGKTVYVTYKDSNYNSYSGSVVIPSTVIYSGTTYSVTSIGEKAFGLCSGLTSVTIPNSVTSIGEYAFYNCSALTSVTIPNSVTKIGADAFSGCSGLTKVKISDIAAWSKISFRNYKANPLYYAHHLYQNGEEVTNLVIPNSVTSIGGSAFSGCSGLKSVTIPNSVTSIGNYAFRECNGLTSVIIPNSVTSIGSSAFSGCSGLTSVTIPNSVTSIGNYAFKECSGLTKVVYNVENCTTMGSHTYPVFDGCSNLTSLTIGENVKTIPSYAFRDCSGLTSVTIPNTVTSIGQYAFSGCPKILSFTSQNATPPTLPSESVFEGMPRSCQLYVPASSKVAYQTAVGWTFFTFVNAFGEGDIATIDSDSVSVTAAGGAIRVEGAEGAEAEVYSLSGALLYRGTDSTIALPRGVYIVKVTGTTTKVVL